MLPAWREQLKWEFRLARRWLGTWLVGAMVLASNTLSLSPERYTTTATIDALVGGSLPLASLLLIIYAIYLAERDRFDRTEEWVAALPQPFYRLFLLRWSYLVIFGGLLMAVLFATAIVYQAALALSPVMIGKYLAGYMVFALPTTLITTAAGLLIGHCFRHPMAAVGLGVIYWGIGSLMPGLSRDLTQFPLEWLAFTGLTAGPQTLSEFWSLFPNQNEIILNRFTYVCLSLTLVTITAHQGGRKRFDHFPRALKLLSAALVLALAVSSVSYASSLTQRHMILSSEKRVLGRTLVTPDQPALFTVAHYQLHLVPSEADHQLEISGEITVRNTGEVPLVELKLSLSPEFLVVADQSGVRWTSPARGQITANLEHHLAPGETRNLPIQYRGNIWSWRHSLSLRQPRLAAFVSSQGLSLPHNFGWYPWVGAVGHQMLVYSGPGSASSLLSLPDVSHVPASFDVRVQSPQQWVLATNTEPSDLDARVQRIRVAESRGLSLIAGPYDKITGARGTMFCSEETSGSASSVLERASAVMRYLEHTHQLPSRPLLIVQSSPWVGPDPERSLPDVVMLTQAQLHNMVAGKERGTSPRWLVEKIIELWWPSETGDMELRMPDRRESVEWAASDAARAFTHSLYAADHCLISPEDELTYRQGMASHKARVDFQRIPQTSFSDASNLLWLQLAEILRTDGRAAVVGKLNQLQAIYYEQGFVSKAQWQQLTERGGR